MNSATDGIDRSGSSRFGKASRLDLNDRRAICTSGYMNELLSSGDRTRSFALTHDEGFSIEYAPTISVGLPWLSLDVSDEWIGRRLILFSHQIPQSRRLALLSSRMGRRLDLETWWFDLLRTAVLHCHSDDELLVTAEGTATCSAVTRAAELFGKPRLHFRPIGNDTLTTSEEVTMWIERTLKILVSQSSSQAHQRTITAFVSPLIQIVSEESQQTCLQNAADRFSCPLADRLQMAAADRLYVISLRNSGFTQTLVAEHLKDGARNASPILVASDELGALPPASQQLPVGWVPWLIEPWDQDRDDGSQGEDLSSHPIINGYSIPGLRRRRTVKASSNNPLTDPDQWLLHWTRPATGPWPNESADDYLESLILRTDTADRTALATLLRIITDGRLIGSSKGVRGGYSVVSLTAVPLHEFPARREFRRHLHRFDFEPWGIAIRKSALADSVRPVIYGDDSTWHSLSETDRAFFQKATFGGATNNVAEQEWRVSGDLFLNTKKLHDLCIFVPNSDAAELVSQHCDWCVVVVPN
jgi:hypothetical protein